MNYRKVPFMNGYDPMYPGAGFLSGAAPAKPVKVILRASRTLAPGWPGFMAWLAGAHPQLYALMQVRFPNLALYTQNGDPASVIPGMMHGLGATDSLTPIDVTAQTMALPSYGSSGGSSGGWASDLVSALTSAAPTVISTIDQQKIFNTQLSRAQQGLPPLNTGSYGLPSMQGAFATLTTPVMLMVGVGVVALIAMRRGRG